MKPIETGIPRVAVSSWPAGRRFALFLSHDVDQIHDRELWRILADVNHARRVMFKGEQGSVGEVLRRMGRSLARPKAAHVDFETILGIESAHGFRSTFFLLHDGYWHRDGARYRLAGRSLAGIVDRILASGCEIGLHGGVSRFNDAARYEESRELIETLFGVEVAGIRNHLLRFSGPATWVAQAAAGFVYDATFGFADRPGAPSGKCAPFAAWDGDGSPLPLVELPLTLMDATIFRYMGLAGGAALEASWKVVQEVVGSRGLVTLLWHNNYFNEPEYADWQEVYEALLARLAGLEPWCATGREIAGWWKARQSVQVSGNVEDGGRYLASVTSGADIDGLALEVAGIPPGRITVSGIDATIGVNGSGAIVSFPRFRAGERVEITIRESA